MPFGELGYLDYSFWHSWEGNVYHPWYSFSIPYEDNAPTRIREKLSRKNPYVCPHCGNNHSSLQREGEHLYCFICGWRDSFYFNQGINDFIKWVTIRERKYGEPRLCSDYERHILDNAALRQRNYKNNHREEIRIRDRERSKTDEYKEKKKKYGVIYLDRHKKEKSEYQRQYRKEHKTEISEYNRQYRERRKNECVEVK